MVSDTQDKTISTYNEIATRYYSLWHDRSAIQAHLDRFSAMLHAYNLQHDIVIDVGCGPGFDSAILREKGLNVIGIDLSYGMLQVGRQRFQVPLVQADMLTLPLAARIGGLWVSASLLHLCQEDAYRAFEDFINLLLPGGLLYLSLKAGSGDGWSWKTYNRPRYFTYWRPDTLDATLKKFGFDIVDGWEGDGLSETWIIRFCRKPASNNLVLAP
jgi:SAM-dependent methyltransferase